MNNNNLMNNNNNMSNSNQMNSLSNNLVNLNNNFPTNNSSLNQNNLQNRSQNRTDNSLYIENLDKENKKLKSLLFTEGYEDFFPLTGLSNVGMTCYMNSTLQCLLHIPELTDYFINRYTDEVEKIKKIYKDIETHGRLSQEYYEVVKGVCQSLFNPKPKKKNYFFYDDDSFPPKKFNTVLSRLNPQFTTFESNDSKDLLLYLLQTMHEELNYFGDQKLDNIPKCNQLIEKESYDFFIKVNFTLNLSIISYLFYGIIKTITICKKCGYNLYNFQYFQFLSFPLYNFKGKIFNIFQGFKEFIVPENMAGDNQCYCQNCKGLVDSTVSSKIYYTPPYLIINIDYGKNKKYKPLKVEFGEIIDIEDFTDKNCNKKTYELIAVSTHIGSSGSSGHYIAYCKDKKKVWHKFNDSSHNECIFKEVNSYSPYLLIFKRNEDMEYIY